MQPHNALRQAFAPEDVSRITHAYDLTRPNRRHESIPLWSSHNILVWNLHCLMNYTLCFDCQSRMWVER